MEITSKYGIIDNILMEIGEEPLTSKETNALMKEAKIIGLQNAFIEAVCTYHTTAFIEYVYRIIGREILPRLLTE